MNQPPPEQFLEACGALAPPQLEVEHQERHEMERRALSLPFALIGRDARADLPLQDDQVSIRHAYLQMVAGRLWCVDLDSRTGIHWATGSRSAGLVDRGQSIRIGPFALRLLAGWPDNEGAASPGPSPLSSHSRDPLSLPRVGLEFLDGMSRQPLWLLDRVLTLVGRSSHCTVRLHSLTVSRTHCALLHTSAGLWLIDLLGREGTFVNGTPLRWARLDDGDELRIGQFRARARFLGQPRRRAVTTLRLSLAENEEIAEPESVAVAPPALPEKAEAEKAEQEPQPSVKAVISSALFAGGLPGDLGNLFSSTESAAPAPSAVVPAGSGSVETLLMPVLMQFSQMQQQMFDQFQQALVTVVQMFSGLHRDQMQLIRQELNQLHEVTRELWMLQAELAKQPAPRVQSETDPLREVGTAPALNPEAPGIADTPSGMDALSPAFSPSSLNPDAPGIADTPRETGAQAPAPSRPTWCPDAPGIVDAPRETDAQPPAPSSPEPPPPSTFVETTAASSSAAPPPQVPGRDDPEVHAWLSRRLVALQEERQSRWLKILNALTGKRTEEPIPD